MLPDIAPQRQLELRPETARTIAAQWGPALRVAVVSRPCPPPGRPRPRSEHRLSTNGSASRPVLGFRERETPRSGPKMPARPSSRLTARAENPSRFSTCSRKRKSPHRVGGGFIGSPIDRLGERGRRAGDKNQNAFDFDGIGSGTAAVLVGARAAEPDPPLRSVLSTDTVRWSHWRF